MKGFVEKEAVLAAFRSRKARQWLSGYNLWVPCSVARYDDNSALVRMAIPGWDGRIEAFVHPDFVKVKGNPSDSSAKVPLPFYASLKQYEDVVVEFERRRTHRMQA